jgi:hypothetical protein
MSRSPFRRRSNRLNKVLDLVHTDVCGPIRTHSLGGGKYFIEFIDDASRWCEVRFLKSKAEVSKATTEYIALVEIQKGKKIKCFQSDNGAEYTGKEFNDYLKKRGITRRFTAPYNPEQNGTAERKNRTLLDSAKCLLQKESNLRNSFWAEAVNTANYRLPTKSLDGRTPYEVWTDKVPDISHFRVFGARVFYLDQELEEFDSRGQEGIFLGYAVQSVSLRPTGWVEPGTKLIKKERQSNEKLTLPYRELLGSLTSLSTTYATRHFLCRKSPGSIQQLLRRRTLDGGKTRVTVSEGNRGPETGLRPRLRAPDRVRRCGLGKLYRGQEIVHRIHFSVERGPRLVGLEEAADSCPIHHGGGVHGCLKVSKKPYISNVCYRSWGPTK